MSVNLTSDELEAMLDRAARRGGAGGAAISGTAIGFLNNIGTIYGAVV
jgi:hypothetical protein